MELFKLLQENTDINCGSWELGFNTYITDENGFTKKEYYTWWMGNKEEIEKRVGFIDFSKDIYELIWFDMTQVSHYTFFGNSLKDIEYGVKEHARKDSLSDYIEYKEPSTKLFELLKKLNKPYTLQYNEHHVDVRHDDDGNVSIDDVIESYCPIRCTEFYKRYGESIISQIKSLKQLQTIYLLKIDDTHLFGNTLKELEDKVRNIHEVER